MKKSALIMIITASVLIMTACGNSSSDEIANIRESGILRVAITQTDSTYTQVAEDGVTYTGMEPELVSYIATALSVEPEYQIVDINDVYNLLESNGADIAIGCIPDDGSQIYNYGVSTSYGSGFLYVVTVEGVYADTFETFAESSIGMSESVIGNSAAAVYGIENGDISIFESTAKAKEALLENTIKGYFCYEKEAEELLAYGGFQAQNLIGATQEEYIVLTNIENKELLSGINALIAQFLEEEISE